MSVLKDVLLSSEIKSLLLDKMKKLNDEDFLGCRFECLPVECLPGSEIPKEYYYDHYAEGAGLPYVLSRNIQKIFQRIGCECNISGGDDPEIQLLWKNTPQFSPKILIKGSNISDDHKIFDEMRKRKQFTDIEIEVGGERLAAHRVILCAKSPFFKAMFTNSFADSTESRISLPKENAKTFGLFLDFLYQGYLTFEKIDEPEIFALLPMADKYQMPDLVKVCQKAICQRMTKSNLLEIYLFGKSLNCDALKILCNNFIDNHHGLRDAKADFSQFTDLEQLHDLRDAATNLNLHGFVTSIIEQLLSMICLRHLKKQMAAR